MLTCSYFSHLEQTVSWPRTPHTPLASFPSLWPPFSRNSSKELSPLPSRILFLPCSVKPTAVTPPPQPQHLN
jgi:hypothetical protein